MTGRQKILKAVYPALMAMNKLLGKDNQTLENRKGIKPIRNFYELETAANDGSIIHFDQFKGKKILLVNTASACGYTDQYADLEKLYQQYPGKLIVIGFPANDFKNQEKEDDATIAAFCKVNYGISFPLMRKSQVVKGNDQNIIYKWLTDSEQNGWCNHQPDWNFSKYLISEEGVLTNYFSQNISPLDDVLTKAITR